MPKGQNHYQDKTKSDSSNYYITYEVKLKIVFAYWSFSLKRAAASNIGKLLSLFRFSFQQTVVQNTEKFSSICDFFLAFRSFIELKVVFLAFVCNI